MKMRISSPASQFVRGLPRKSAVTWLEDYFESLIEGPHHRAATDRSENIG
jgi:hypothetical protein